MYFPNPKFQQPVGFELIKENVIGTRKRNLLHVQNFGDIQKLFFS